MSGFAIKRTDQGGGYLGKDPGRTGKTWVMNIAEARRFATHEAADKERCPGNEVVVSVDNELAQMYD